MTRKDRTEGIYNRREVLDESERRQYCLIQLKDLLSYFSHIIYPFRISVFVVFSAFLIYCTLSCPIKRAAKSSNHISISQLFKFLDGSSAAC